MSSRHARRASRITTATGHTAGEDAGFNEVNIVTRCGRHQLTAGDQLLLSLHRKSIRFSTAYLYDVRRVANGASQHAELLPS